MIKILVICALSDNPRVCSEFPNLSALSSSCLKVTFFIGNILDRNELSRLNLIESFDIIYSGSVVHLLAEQDIKKLFSNIYKTLQPGGIFFGQTTGLETPQGARL